MTLKRLADFLAWTIEFDESLTGYESAKEARAFAEAVPRWPRWGAISWVGTVGFYTRLDDRLYYCAIIHPSSELCWASTISLDEMTAHPARRWECIFSSGSPTGNRLTFDDLLRFPDYLMEQAL